MFGLFLDTGRTLRIELELPDPVSTIASVLESMTVTFTPCVRYFTFPGLDIKYGPTVYTRAETIH